MLLYVKKHWRNREFEPGLASLVTNPFHLARKALYCSFAAHAPLLKGRILDVGCGSKPYAKLFINATSYEGLDIDQPRNRERGIADHFYEGKDFPFPNEAFDSLMCSQVLEHVFEPEQFCLELSRILVPGGKLLLTVPFIWDEHEQPWDSRRYTSFGLRDLLEKSGFKVLTQEKLVIGYAAIIQLIQARIQKSYIGAVERLPGKIPKLLGFSYAPLNILGEIIRFLPASNKDLYLDNFLLLERNRS